MTREEANALLDKVLDGQDVPIELINIALWITGDMGSHCD